MTFELELELEKPATRGFDVSFDLRLEYTVEETVVRLVIWDANAAILTSL